MPEIDAVDPTIYISDHSTAVWSAFSAGLSGLGAWFVSIARNNASLERARIKISAEASVSEAAERAAFRATLMAEIAEMRQIIKECETERNLLRERLNAAEGQILVLRASNEIMERWVAFFKGTTGASTVPLLRDVKYDAVR